MMKYPKQAAALSLFVVICVVLLCSLFGCAANLPPQETQNETQAADTEAGSPAPTAGIRLLTTMYGMENHTANAKGYYEWITTENQNSQIYYIDYATLQRIPLCNDPSCHHDDETCTAWFAGYSGNLFCSADGEYLFCSQGMVEQNGNCETLWRMHADGSDRTLLWKLGDGERIVDAAAGEEKTIYMTVSTWDGAKQLYRLDTESGKRDLLLEYEAGKWLYGAYGHSLIFIAFQTQDHSKGSFVYTRYSLDTHQETVFYQYAYDDSGVLEGGAIGRCDGGNLYMILPQGDHLADLQKIDIETGEETLIAQSLPYFGVDTTVVTGFYDGHLLYITSDPSHPEPQHHTYAVSCDTGEVAEIAPLCEMFGAKRTRRICGETEDSFLVVANYTDKPVVHYAKDGTTYTSEEPVPCYAMMKKSDYWNSLDVITEIAG